MQAHEGMLAEVEVSDPQVGHVLCPGPAVVEEHHQGPVSKGEGPVARQPAQQLFDFVTFEELGLGRRSALHGDRCDPPADTKQLRRAGGDVIEERVDGGEALVAGPDVVVPVDLEVTKEFK